MKYRRILVPLLALLMSAGSGFAAQIHISTSSVFLSGRPDTRMTGTFTLSLSPDAGEDISDDLSVHCQSSVRPWFLSDENRDVPVSSWVNISPYDFKVDLKEPVTVTYRVTVPQTAQGYVMGMIAFETIRDKDAEKQEKPEEDTEEEIPQVIKKEDAEETIKVYSVPVYIIIEGTEVISGDITAVTFSTESTDAKKPVTASVTFANTGNIFLRPEEVTLSIYDRWRNPVSEMHAAGMLSPVFPGQSVAYRFSGADVKVLEAGTYSATIMLGSTYPQCAVQDEKDMDVARDGSIAIKNIRD